MQPELYVFDDDEIIIAEVRDAVERLSDALKKDGLELPFGIPEVKSAQDEEKAFEYIDTYVTNGKIPLFIVDINIVTQDSGFKILEKIRANDVLKYSPVILMSGYGEKYFVHKGYEAGANCFVVKSDDAESFPARITDMLRFWLVSMFHTQSLDDASSNHYFSEFASK